MNECSASQATRTNVLASKDVFKTSRDPAKPLPHYTQFFARSATELTALSLAIVGPGSWLADALLGLSFAGVARGIGAIVVALLGVAVQLVQRRALPVGMQSGGVSRQVS